VSGRLQNQLPTISELSDLIGFATRTEVIDDYGAIRLTDSTPTPNVRAKVRYIMTSENESVSKQEKFTTEIKIHIRYDSTLTAEKLVYWGSKWYDIYSLETVIGNRFHVIKARLIET
jgi:head-tail adaptor